jgi:putative holliday junction resolvase
LSPSDVPIAQRRPDPDIVVAFDFGLRRIGVATANLRTRTATPLTTLNARGLAPWLELDRLLLDWQPAQLVVGMPPDQDSNVGRAARAFTAQLTERYALPVARVDESLTSSSVWSALRDARRSGYLRRRIGRDRVDRHAACLIAEQWMSSRTDDSRTD